MGYIPIDTHNTKLAQYVLYRVFRT